MTFRTFTTNTLQDKYHNIYSMSKSMDLPTPKKTNQDTLDDIPEDNELDITDDEPKKDKNRKIVRKHINSSHPGAWTNVKNHPFAAGELSKFILQFSLNPQHELENIPVPSIITWKELGELVKKCNYILKFYQKTILDLGNSGNAYDLRLFLYQNQKKLGLKNITKPFIVSLDKL